MSDDLDVGNFEKPKPHEQEIAILMKYWDDIVGVTDRGGINYVRCGFGPSTQTAIEDVLKPGTEEIVANLMQSDAFINYLVTTIDRLKGTHRFDEE